ncbi:MAG TPA: hypothetical protein VK838_05600 [Candidatus Limnocylindrales bacterium]|nr:hypothetical protein [Candidatus Limnocylindrales bacterium]
MTERDDPGRENAAEDRSTEAGPSPATPATATESAALRDAQAIAERVAADEKAADAERNRLASEPLPTMAANAEMVVQLHPHELLHAERRAAVIERRQEGQPSSGILYLTSQRLVHTGNERVEELPLERIADMAVAMERLLLIELTDGSDLAIEVDRPRLLRVQVSAARAATRGRKV